MKDLELLKTEPAELIGQYERAVVAHAVAHREHDALLMRKPVEKDLGIRRVMAQGQPGFTAYTAAEKLVEDEPGYRVFLATLREADYKRMVLLGEVQADDHRCALAIALAVPEPVMLYKTVDP